jgi:hypothetical protein
MVKFPQKMIECRDRYGRHLGKDCTVEHYRTRKGVGCGIMYYSTLPQWFFADAIANASRIQRNHFNIYNYLRTQGMLSYRI